MSARLPAYIALLSAIALAAVLVGGNRNRVEAQEPTLVGSLPTAGGFGLAVWSGGAPDALLETAQSLGCNVRSVFANRPTGGLVGYFPTALAAPNRDFLSAYPAGLPASTPVVVVCNTGGSTPTPTPTATATSTPTATPTPSVSYPEPGAPEGISLFGNISPFSATQVRVIAELRGTSSGSGDVTRVRLCSTTDTVSECHLEPPVPPGTLDPFYYFDVPSPGVATFLTMQVCNDVGCSDYFYFGQVRHYQSDQAQFYVVASPFSAQTLTGVFVLDPSTVRIKIEYSDGFTLEYACAGVGRCGSFEFHETKADSVMITAYQLDPSVQDSTTLRLR